MSLCPYVLMSLCPYVLTSLRPFLNFSCLPYTKKKRMFFYFSGVEARGMVTVTVTVALSVRFCMLFHSLFCPFLLFVVCILGSRILERRK